MWEVLMMKRWIAGLLVLVLLSAMVAPALGRPLRQEGEEVEVAGTITEVDLEAGLLFVDGVPYVLGDDVSVCAGPGRCGQMLTVDDLEVGMWVELTGIAQGDGTVVLQRIHIEEAEDPEGDEPPEGWQHPVALKLSMIFDLTYEEVLALQEDGIGFGQIKKAYLLADLYPDSGMAGADFLEAKLSGLGWGQIAQEAGVHPGHGKPPWAGGPDQEDDHGPPPWAGQGRGRSDGNGNGPPPWAGQGRGRGNGNGNGPPANRDR
jgi:hypothetical protein